MRGITREKERKRKNEIQRERERERYVKHVKGNLNIDDDKDIL